MDCAFFNLETLFSLSLAGSLGIPIWMLHPRSPRTRWAFQTTTPWYPSMRIFDYEGSWKKTLQTITETLKYGGMV